MSDSPLSDALEKSLQDTLSARGDMLTGFVGLATYIDKDGEKMWTVFCGDNQGTVATMGMVNLLKLYDDAQISNKFRDRD